MFNVQMEALPMNQWKQNLARPHMSPEELRKIPGTSCESVSFLVRYAQMELGVPVESLLSNVSVGYDYIQNTDLWIDPIDDLQIQKNIIRSCPTFLPHRQFTEIGKQFSFSPNSNLALLYRMSSASMVFRDLQKNMDRFSSYFIAHTQGYKRGSVDFTLQYQEFYRSLSDGVTLFLAEGIFLSNLLKHGARKCETIHRIIGISLQTLVSNYYGHLPWQYQVVDGVVQINGQELARPVVLEPVKSESSLSYRYNPSYTGEGPEALLITQDFYWANSLVFSQGEVYGAPCSVLQLRWKDPPFIKKLQRRTNRKKEFLSALQELERGISRANERYFEAAEALRTNRHQSQILQVYTKKILSERALAGDDPTKWLPRKRQVAVLFCDIRGFTNLSERLSAEEIVSFLNDFFGRMNGLITQQGGEIDKLMGDSVMAQFADADQALLAMIDMNKELQSMNRERFSQELPRIDIGIGVSWGDVIQGNIGTAARMDYTIVGDTVNVASRLESLTKHYQVQCIISQDVLNRLTVPVKTRFLDKVQVKGKVHPVSIYEVFESDPEWVQEIKSTTQPLYELAYKVYESGDFSRAVSLYAKIYRQIGPHSLETALSADPVVLFYMDRARELRDAVEDGEFDLSRWSGVYKFETG